MIDNIIDLLLPIRILRNTLIDRLLYDGVLWMLVLLVLDFSVDLDVFALSNFDLNLSL